MIDRPVDGRQADLTPVRHPHRRPEIECTCSVGDPDEQDGEQEEPEETWNATFGGVGLSHEISATLCPPTSSEPSAANASHNAVRHPPTNAINITT
jgi:hypothetical protein